MTGMGKNRWPPGDLVIWIFIMAELLVFGVFFSAYAFTRANHVELFNTYQLTLDRNAALINTVALITSSYFVVRAVADIRANDSRGCFRWLLAALAMGLLFLRIPSFTRFRLRASDVSSPDMPNAAASNSLFLSSI